MTGDIEIEPLFETVSFFFFFSVFFARAVLDWHLSSCQFEKLLKLRL